MFGITKKEHCLVISSKGYGKPEFLNLKITPKAAKARAIEEIRNGASSVKITMFNGDAFVDVETVSLDTIEAPQ